MRRVAVGSSSGVKPKAMGVRAKNPMRPGANRVSRTQTASRMPNVQVSRRSFLKTAGFGVAGIVGTGLGFGKMAKGQAVPGFTDRQVTVSPMGTEAFDYEVPNYWGLWDIAFPDPDYIPGPKTIPATADIAEIFVAVNGLHFKAWGIDFYFTEDPTKPPSQSNPYLQLPSGDPNDPDSIPAQLYNYAPTERPVVTLEEGMFNFGDIPSLFFDTEYEDQGMVKITDADFPLNHFYGYDGEDFFYLYEGDLSYSYAGGIAGIWFTRDAEIKGTAEDGEPLTVIQGGFHCFRMEGGREGADLFVRDITFNEPLYSAGLAGYGNCNIYAENCRVYGVYALLGTSNPERFGFFTHNNGRYEVKDCIFDNSADNQMSFILNLNWHSPDEIEYVAVGTECTICPSFSNPETLINSNTIIAGTTRYEDGSPRGLGTAIAMPLIGSGAMGPVPKGPIPVNIRDNPIIQADTGILAVEANGSYSITNNHFRASDTALSLIYPTYGTDFGTISQNTFEMVDYAPPTAAVLGIGCKGAAIDTNYHHGMALFGMLFDDAASDNIVAGNEFIGSFPEGYMLTGGFELFAIVADVYYGMSARKNSVVDNVFGPVGLSVNLVEGSNNRIASNDYTATGVPGAWTPDGWSGCVFLTPGSAGNLVSETQFPSGDLCNQILDLGANAIPGYGTCARLGPERIAAIQAALDKQRAQIVQKVQKALEQKQGYEAALRNEMK